MTSAKSRGLAVLAFVTASALVLAACDGGASAVRTVGDSGGKSTAYAANGGGNSGVDHRKDPTPLLDGKPMWAANRLHGAEDNARYHFKRDGQSFGASSVEDYVRTAQAFIAAPPAGSEIIKRSNGDKLIFDPRGGVFAVATSEGAPRTFFKPKDGAAYWEKQKAAGDKPFGTKRKGSDGSGDSSSGDDRQG